jgi:hypothetical protein
MRNPFSWFVFALAVSTLLLVGCGDDSSTDSGSNSQLGDPNDPEFQAIQANIESMVGLGAELIDFGTARVDGFDSTDFFELNLGKRSAVTDTSITVLYSPDGWWIATFAASEYSDGFTMNIEVYDSLRYQNLSGVAQMIPDETTNSFAERTRVEFAVDGDSAEVDMLSYAGLEFTNLQSPVVDVNGDISLAMSGEFVGDSVSGNLYMSISYTLVDVSVPVSGESCPTGGVISFSVTENLTSLLLGEGTASITWSARVTVVDQNTYRVKVDMGDTSWAEYTLTDVCNGLQASGLPELVKTVMSGNFD